MEDPKFYFQFNLFILLSLLTTLLVVNILFLFCIIMFIDYLYIFFKFNFLIIFGFFSLLYFLKTMCFYIENMLFFMFTSYMDNCLHHFYTFQYEGGFNFYTVSGDSKSLLSTGQEFYVIVCLILFCGIEFNIFILFLLSGMSSVLLFCFSVYTFFVFIIIVKRKRKW